MRIEQELQTGGRFGQEVAVKRHGPIAHPAEADATEPLSLFGIGLDSVAAEEGRPGVDDDLQIVVRAGERRLCGGGVDLCDGRRSGVRCDRLDDLPLRNVDLVVRRAAASFEARELVGDVAGRVESEFARPECGRHLGESRRTCEAGERGRRARAAIEANALPQGLG